MRLYSLAVENIGPFDHAEVEFLKEGDASPGLTLLTGVNGTGKTILIDAIRGMFGHRFAELGRALWRDGEPFTVSIRHSFHGEDGFTPVNQIADGKSSHNRFDLKTAMPSVLPAWVQEQAIAPPGWVVDFWDSQLATDDPHIKSLGAIDHTALYQGALQGTVSASSITHLLSHFDYLRDSRSPAERATGEALYALAEKIVRFSLLDGELVGIERLTFTPKVRQGGHEVPLGNISSGNAYLVQRLISLLGRMYSLHVLRKSDPAEIHRTPGLLLIDEAENHLHPVWQKRFLPGVREIFPNLQIIATTHSPFVVASVPDARVYVCQYDPATRKTTVSEETAAYQNKPVDEILMSPAFDQTPPFGETISRLMIERQEAIQAGDEQRRDDIERRLVQLNPTYFGYLDIDRRLEALRKAG